MSKILIIDENTKCWKALKNDVESTHQLTFWAAGKGITSHLREKDYDILLLNFQLDTIDSFKVLPQIRKVSPYTPVVAISEVEETDLIVRAVKEGAFDFVVNPFSKEKIMLTIQRGLENRNLKKKGNLRLKVSFSHSTTNIK